MADENDEEIRARFARVEEQARLDAAPHDVLPPVPEVKFERPALPGAKSAAKGTSSGSEWGNSSGPASGGGTLLGSAGNVRGFGLAMTIGTNLVASILVGTGLGWAADRYLLHSAGTPWGLIVGFMLGVASGFVSLVRTANRLNDDAK